MFRITGIFFFLIANVGSTFIVRDNSCMSLTKYFPLMSREIESVCSEDPHPIAINNLPLMYVYLEFSKDIAVIKNISINNTICNVITDTVKYGSGEQFSSDGLKVFAQVNIKQLFDIHRLYCLFLVYGFMMSKCVDSSILSSPRKCSVTAKFCNVTYEKTILKL